MYMKKNELSLLRIFFALSDVVLVNLCLFVGFYLSNKYGHRLSKSVYTHNILSVSVFWLLSTTLFKLYGEYTIYKLKDINKATWRSIVLFLVVFQIYILIMLPVTTNLYNFSLAFYS